MPIDENLTLAESHRLSRLAAEYARQFPTLERWFIVNRPRICPFTPLVEAVPTSSRVLDIGCGTGLFLFMLRAERQITGGIGVDIEAKHIVAGQDALNALGVDNLQLQCVTDISGWPSEEFDAVTMIDVLHHCSPPAQRAFFESACAHVRKGGYLIYKDMCRSPLWMAWANRLHDLLKARQWIHYVPIESVELWAVNQGFGVVVSERIDMYIYGHELRVFERLQLVGFE